MTAKTSSDTKVADTGADSSTDEPMYSPEDISALQSTLENIPDNVRAFIKASESELLPTLKKWNREISAYTKECRKDMKTMRSADPENDCLSDRELWSHIQMAASLANNLKSCLDCIKEQTLFLDFDGSDLAVKPAKGVAVPPSIVTKKKSKKRKLSEEESAEA